MTIEELEQMNLEDLKDLQRKVNKAVTEYETRRREEALLAAQKTVREMGFDLNELMSPKKGKKVHPPKYQNPDRPSQTWTGRGRHPDWVRAKVEKGHDLDEFLIT